MIIFGRFCADDIWPIIRGSCGENTLGSDRISHVVTGQSERIEVHRAECWEGHLEVDLLFDPAVVLKGCSWQDVAVQGWIFKDAFAE